MSALPEVVLVSDDLFFSSQAVGAASHAGLKMITAGTTAAVVARLTENTVAGVIVDLGNTRANIAELCTEIRNAVVGKKPPHIVAFGPHVQKELLATAEQAGCDEVLTKGQFSANLQAILNRCAESLPASHSED